MLTAHGELCWVEIKAKTGFASYEEYLDAHESEYPSLTSIRTAIGHPRQDFDPCPLHCSLFDLSQRADSATEIKGLEYSGGKALHTTLLGDLYLPPSGVSLRVLLWWVVDSPFPLTSRFLDVCGFGLEMDPEFFITLADRLERFPVEGDRRFSMRSFQPSYTLIGNHIISVARDYIPGRTDTPPVLLVVGWSDEKLESQAARDPYHLGHVPRVLDGIPSRQLQSRERFGQAYLNCKDYRSRGYAEILSQVIGRNKWTATGDDQVLFLAMLPLLQLDALHIQGKCRSVRRLHIELGPSSRIRFSSRLCLSDLTSERFWLRRHIEDAEASRIYFIWYMRRNGQSSIFSNAEYQRAEESWNDIIHEARGLDSEVCDHVQLQVGQSSLEESKKSIELSTLQIEESKRSECLIAFLTSATNSCLVKICKVYLA